MLSRLRYRVAADVTTYDSAEYRAACFGCPWMGSTREDESAATEDAHDHCFPEWRSLPAIEPYRYDDEVKRARLAQRLVALYPPERRERHGPTVTYRDYAFATRHVPGGGLYGGYCMSRRRANAEREFLTVNQLELFAKSYGS